MATTNQKVPGHIFLKDETTNFFLGHLMGILASTLTTLIIWFIITNWIFDSLGVYTYVIFAICEYFTYNAIEATREKIEPLWYAPITVNDKFIEKFAGAGSYVLPFPFGLIMDEKRSIEPIFFEGPEIQTLDANNQKIIGGKRFFSIKVDFSNGKKFTKNTEENLKARLIALSGQEIVSLISKEKLSDSTSGLRSELEQISKEMLDPQPNSKLIEVKQLCQDSGATLLGLQIGEFNYQDEEDKDAAASKKRAKDKNEGLLEDATTIALQMQAMKTAFAAAGLTYDDEAIKDLWEQKFGGKQKIDIANSGGGSGGNGANIVFIPPSTK